MMKDRKVVIRSFVLITQLGFSVMAPIFLCIFIGNLLDTRFGWTTSAWLLLLGFLAGGRNGWCLIRAELEQEEKERSKKEDQHESEK